MRLAVGRGDIQEELPGFTSGLCWALEGPGPQASSWGPGLLRGGRQLRVDLSSPPRGFSVAHGPALRWRMRRLREGRQLKAPALRASFLGDRTGTTVGALGRPPRVLPAVSGLSGRTWLW